MYRDDRFLGTTVYWARGNAWALCALSAALQHGAADPFRSTYLRIFRQLATRIASLQSADGAWRSSLLHPVDYPQPEASATAAFTYSLGWGVLSGILPAEVHTPVVARAWAWLSKEALQRPGGLVGYCQPGASEPERNTFNRSTTTNFCVGQFLMAASQVARLTEAMSLMV